MERTRGGIVVECGVSFYTNAKIEYEFGFPDGMVTCQMCPYCYDNSTLKRYRCRITGEFLPYPFSGVGAECPITELDGKPVNPQEVE